MDLLSAPARTFDFKAAPVITYAVFAVIGLIIDISNSVYPIGSYIIKILTDGAMIGLIAFLCAKGYNKLAWAIVFLPLILFFALLIMVMIYYGAAPNKKTTMSYASFL